METELITAADLEHLEHLLHRHGGRIEYLVGSVHHVNGVPIDLDQPTFHVALATCQGGTELNSEGDENENKDYIQQTLFLTSYLDAQYDLLRRFRPEVVGHLDLCRLYTPTLRFCDFLSALACLERNIRFAVSYGAVFEVNAAAFRKGWDSAYPGDDVLEVILPPSPPSFTITDPFLTRSQPPFIADSAKRWQVRAVGRQPRPSCRRAKL